MEDVFLREGGRVGGWEGGREGREALDTHTPEKREIRVSTPPSLPPSLPSYLELQPVHGGEGQGLVVRPPTL